ncbi:MAG TPA: VCBS repeat-containing protein [Rhodocyclaceae bacterium]
MKIASSQVQLSAQHQSLIQTTQEETLRAWKGDQRPDFEGRQRNGVTADLSASGRALAMAVSSQSQEIDSRAHAIDEAAQAAENDPIVILLKTVVEMLTGKHIDLIKPINVQGAGTTAPPQAAPAQANANTSTSTPPRRAGYGVEYDYHAVRDEVETTQFSASGTIQTSDGKQIDFQLELSMARHYHAETNVSLRAGDAQRKDPLVLNFNGTAAQLSDQHFAFDLNGNGVKEQVAMLAPGNAWLALDRNGNGRIDSGKELFGPQSGSGFADLAALDSDHNGWIDENDPAFQQLRLWSPDGQAGGALETLAQRHVGALHLGEVRTPFELRGKSNADLGAVAASGFYVTDDGHANSLAEIDLTV